MKQYEVVIDDKIEFVHQNKQRARIFYEAYKPKRIKILQKNKNGIITKMASEVFLDLSVLDMPVAETSLL